MNPELSNLEPWNLPPRMWAIVPAAGISRRLLRAPSSVALSPKQVLPYQGSTLTGAVTRTLLDAHVDGVVVVTRTVLIDSLRLPEDGRVHIAINDRADSEMIDSVRIGLCEVDRLTAAGPDSSTGNDGVVVVPADMPTLSTEACRRCIAAYLGSLHGGAGPQQIVIAAYPDPRAPGDAHPGHPIIFPYSMRSAVDRLEGGLHMLPRRYPHRVLHVRINEPEVLHDVDTIDDYNGLPEPGGLPEEPTRDPNHEPSNP